jgi:hypothetical protein
MISPYLKLFPTALAAQDRDDGNEQNDTFKINK